VFDKTINSANFDSKVFPVIFRRRLHEISEVECTTRCF